MLLTVFLISIVLVAFVFVGLGLNMLIRKNGKFPETEVGSNKDMHKLGITCTKHDEMKEFRKEKRARKAGIPAVEPPLRDCGYGCSCSADEF
jgi:hypothetical protein